MINSEIITESINYVQGLRNFHSFLKRNSHFILSTHVNPDGDGLGSQIALHDFLEQKNKKCYIVNQDKTPQRYLFLDMESVIQAPDGRQLNPKLLQKAALIIIDANHIERIGSVGPMMQPHVKEIFIIDHHLTDEEIVKKNFILEQATSTGEIIYHILHSMNASFNYKSAQALYTSILTDTGSFRFPKTDWRTHHIVSELLKEGVNPSAVFQEVYENSSPGRLRLLAVFLNNLTFDCDNKLAFSYVTEKMVEDSGASNEEMDGFVNMPLENRGVRVSVLVKFYKDQIKAALRSKGAIDVSAVAQHFGGGGHFNASGFRMQNNGNYTVDSLRREIVDQFAQTLVSPVR